MVIRLLRAADGVELILADLLLFIGDVAEVFIALEGAFTLHAVHLHVLAVAVAGLADHVEVHLAGLLPLFVRDLGTVDLGQLRKHLNYVVSVVLLLAARVVAQPQNLEVLQLLKVQDLGQVGDVILAQIEFLDLGAVSEMLQRLDFVDRERHHLQVGQLPDELDVVQLAAPEVDVLDLLEVVFLALFGDQVLGQRVSHFQIL